MIRRNRNTYWGFILIVIALVTLGITFDLITGNITKLVWACILGAIAVSNLFQLSWGGVFFPVAIIAHIFRPELGIPGSSVWALYLAAAFLTAGMSIITRNMRHRRRRGFTVNVDGKDININGKEIKDKVKESMGGLGSSFSEGNNGEVVYIENNFGDASKYVNQHGLRFASIENNFGNLRVYFDNTVFASTGATIKVESNFGKITLYFPRNINISNSLRASLGAITGENGRAYDPDVPTVNLTGEATFGNIEVVII